MNSTTTLPLFEGNPGQPEAPRPTPTSRLGMAAAPARLVAYRDSLNEDNEERVLLVVACPFCDHQHIHPAGLASAPRVCLRRSRCVGRPTGVYYFPAVHQ
ncbi:hypothetical protein R1T08_24280 [Streptomyces sp. SBC-4]|nr:hypothetical protein [Streptomyces sp. SBC-4]MDV5147208.1 hypothetical protein [Streptomyces sp. SBC-4]